LTQYTPRNLNATKAMANWEKKSAYLLREIVKFRTYIDSLINAQQIKEKIYKEREERAGTKKIGVNKNAEGLQQTRGEQNDERAINDDQASSVAVGLQQQSEVTETV
jgi:hypothetical protein